MGRGKGDPPENKKMAQTSERPVLTLTSAQRSLPNGGARGCACGGGEPGSVKGSGTSLLERLLESN